MDSITDHQVTITRRQVVAGCPVVVLPAERRQGLPLRFESLRLSEPDLEQDQVTVVVLHRAIQALRARERPRRGVAPTIERPPVAQTPPRAAPSQTPSAEVPGLDEWFSQQDQGLLEDLRHEHVPVDQTGPMPLPLIDPPQPLPALEPMVELADEEDTTADPTHVDKVSRSEQITQDQYAPVPAPLASKDEIASHVLELEQLADQEVDIVYALKKRKPTQVLSPAGEDDPTKIFS